MLAVLLTASLALLTAFFQAEGPNAVERGAQEALGPFERGVSRAVRPVRDLVAWGGDLFGAQGENRRLREENARLKSDLARNLVNRRDAEQLRAFVKLSERDGFPFELTPVGARVIAHSSDAWYSAVTIDKGRGDGVRVDQAVTAGVGLVGRISATTASTARVTLITDSSSSVSAQIMPDGAKGVVKPEVARPEDLLLRYVEKGRPVGRGGAMVVTSGFRSSRLESIFPRGIPIGEVKRVDRGELELYQRVHLRPYADLRRLDLVQVLTDGPAGTRASIEGTAE